MLKLGEQLLRSIRAVDEGKNEKREFVLSCSRKRLKSKKM